MREWLREPLVHFVAIGALLFILSGTLGSSAPVDDTIVVSTPEIARLVQLFTAQWQRPPTRTELDNLIEQHIREEVLYREAVAMGLDQNDTIVRRRIVQKLEFLSQDLVDENPSDAELRAFFGEHSDRYIEPAVISFEHVFLNPDDHGEALAAVAARTLSRLRAGDDPATLGDTFLLPASFAQRSTRELSGLFGENFAASLEELGAGEWLGPVTSGYGVHMVRIDDRIASHPMDFEANRDKVRTDYLSASRREADAAMYARLRARYRIEVADLSALDASQQ
jgi:hypothetical protein